MSDDLMSAADMITRVFSNIDRASIEKATKLFSAWKETVLKINGYGEKLAAHTKVIDLKNGVLLVETDHPGWSQILQLNEDFIIRGLNWKAPKLGVKNLMLRLEGSEANFSAANYDDLVRESQQKIEMTGQKNQDSNAKYQELPKSTLPPELLAKFDAIKKGMDEMR